MEANNSNRAPPETRPLSSGPGGPDPAGPTQLPPRPPLHRTDSRSSFPQQGPRPNFPPQPQQRPQFQPGGPVTNPPQYAPRPGTPVPRGPVPGSPGAQQPRPQGLPLRPVGPQQYAPQQGPRPLQSPTSGQPPQRVPLPNNLQFGPRQPPQFGATTPESARPQLVQQPNGAPKNGVHPGQTAVTGQIPRQPSQGSLRGLDSSSTFQNQPVNLENQTFETNVNKPENGSEIAGMAKGRSYSIAAAPGAPSPLKMEDDRRKSISAVGGKIEDYASRAPGLGLIQEKLSSKDNIRGSRESIRSEASNDGTKDVPERPESRLAGSKMTESFIGSLPTPRSKFDDNDDVVLQTIAKNGSGAPVNQRDLSERSPSLTRSDDSPELKQNVPMANPIVKPANIPPEPQRPKTPSVKQENRPESKPPMPAKSPVQDSKPPMHVNKKPNEINTNNISPESKKSTTPRKSASAPKTRPKDGDNDSGVDESTQGNDLNGSPGSPNKKLPSKLPTKEKSSNSIKTSLSRSSSKSATAKTPENPPAEKKKVPMNKIQVGNAPSPNIKAVKSKIGSLENATYKPGGGNVKIENRKLEFGNVTPRIAAKNDKYTPSGGVKKIPSTKLEWNAKSKIGSLQNASYKPGGGDKKIETVKLDFKDKAKPKVSSTANIHHKAGGGAVKIENQKLEFKAQSKVGSLDNVKHKPGGGDIKIFDDKEYIKQKSGSSTAVGSHTHSRQEDYYTSEWSDEERPERPASRCKSARAPRTPRMQSPRRKSIVQALDEEQERVLRNNERNRRAANTRPISARDPPRSACSRRGSILQRPAFTDYYTSEWSDECRPERTAWRERNSRAVNMRPNSARDQPQSAWSDECRPERSAWRERVSHAVNMPPNSARDQPHSACSRRGSILQRPAFTVY